MDCSPPDSSVHGIFQARILECAVISFSRVSFQLKDPIHIFCLTGGLFTTEPPGKSFIFGDMVKTLKIHPLSKFPVLVINNLILLYWDFVLLEPRSSISLFPQHLSAIFLLSASMILTILESTDKWNHTMLSFCIWSISFSILSSRLIWCTFRLFPYLDYCE